jgi:uncharacterized protein with PQ loop repeat
VLEAGLTVVAVVLALTQPVPQVVRVVRAGSIAGLSGPTTWLGFVINVGWLAYGWAQGLLPVLVLSIAYVVGYGTIGALLVRHGNRSGLLAAGGAAAAGSLLVVMLGWTALGTVLALAVGFQFLPQVLLAWHSTDLSGLAPGTYVVAALDGVVWGGYGLAVADGPLMLYGVVMCTVAVAVLVPCRRWRRRAALVV